MSVPFLNPNTTSCTRCLEIPRVRPALVQLPVLQNASSILCCCSVSSIASPGGPIVRAIRSLRMTLYTDHMIPSLFTDRMPHSVNMRMAPYIIERTHFDFNRLSHLLLFIIPATLVWPRRSPVCSVCQHEPVPDVATFLV